MSIFSPFFKDDIFINYSRADNSDPRDSNNHGWVDALHEKLKQRLRQLTGNDPIIWRDVERLPGHYQLTETLVLTLERVALLVSILSPSYLTSKWCKKELDAFYQRAAAAGKIYINNKSRIFKVIKTPVAEEKYPQQFKDLPGYKFYDVAPNGMPREYSHIQDFYGFSEFRHQLEVLAWDISRFVDLCQGIDLYPRTVYLAETTGDLAEVREEIKLELETHDYHILPDKPLPTSGPEFLEGVRSYLRRSRLSIHLVSGESSTPPARCKQDSVYLQHSLALEHQNSSDLFRVVWTPIGLKTRDLARQKFVSQLRTRPKFQKDAELLLGNTKPKSLKTYVLNKMRDLASVEPAQERTERPPEKPHKDANEVVAHGELAVDVMPFDPLIDEQINEPICVYLICNKRDFKSGAFVPLRDYLLDVKGYNVTLPVMKGKPKEAIADHDRNLAECDVAIIFYGQVDESWVRLKLNDLRKIIVNGRTKPRPVNAVYITEPMDDIKKYYRTTPEYQVVLNDGEFNDSQYEAKPLEPLMEEIRKRFPQDKSRGVEK
jgi:hypothetical protein